LYRSFCLPFCFKCGKDLPDGVDFCAFCGESTRLGPSVPSVVPTPPARPSQRTRNILIGVVLILVVLVAAGSIAPRQTTTQKTLTVTTSTVEYVTILQTVTMQATPTLPKTGEPGTSRFNPLPLGKTLVVDEWEISVIGIERDAYGKLKDFNMFNSAPGPGEEAVLVKLNAKLIGSPEVKSSLNQWSFKLVGEKGSVYEHRVDVLEPAVYGREIFGGTAIQGYLSFNVASGEKGLVLIYNDVWYLATE